MPIGCFPHQGPPPDAEAVGDVLGPALPLWTTLTAELEAAARQPGTWKSYGARAGWRLDFRKGKGPLAGLYPQSGHLILGLNLVRRESAAAFALPLSPESRTVLEASTPLPDGRFVLLPVSDVTALADALALIALKVGR